MPLRHILIHADFFDDDAFFFGDFAGIEKRMIVHVGNDVETNIEMTRVGFGIIAGVFLAGESIVLRADRVKLARNVNGLRPRRRPFENHVLEKMGNAVGRFGLILRAGFDHDKYRHRRIVGHRYGDTAKAVLKSGFFEMHRVDVWDLCRNNTIF